MAWTTPKTFSTSEILTASILNTHLRDQLNTLRKMNDYCSIMRFSDTSGQSIANNSMTAVTWHEITFNGGGMWASGSPSRVTIAVTGFYDFAGVLSWDNNSSGIRICAWRKDGGGLDYLLGETAPVVGDPTVMPISDLVYLTSAAYIELRAYQDSGNNLTLNYAGDGSRWAVRLAGTT